MLFPYVSSSKGREPAWSISSSAFGVSSNGISCILEQNNSLNPIARFVLLIVVLLQQVQLPKPQSFVRRAQSDWQERRTNFKSTQAQSAVTHMMPAKLLPLDSYNEHLLSRVHPNNWINPKPAAQYDLVVIGAGTAGLVVAAGAAGLGLGLKVALVEKSLMGGDCLNVGCVPSKCVIRASRAVADTHNAALFGVQAPADFPINFAAVMQRMRRIRAQISHHDSAERFRKLGVDVFLGTAQFVDSGSVAVGSSILRFTKAVIATGARATRPNVPGLEASGFLTNETVFSLTERPPRLAVIGGGPIGCELAQAFHRLGSQVTLFHKREHLLDREDTDAAAIIQERFLREHLHLILGCSLEKVEKTNEGKVIYYRQNGVSKSVVVDEILVGAGRTPNVERLNLEAVGVQYDARRGVIVNDYLQTANARIYAAGDVCMNWKYTHAADAAARIVIKNALFSPFGLGRSKVSTLVMPWSTYTDPEIAHVGLYEHEAQERGMSVNIIKVPLNTVDRAIMDGETEGFIKILHAKGSDKILGATIVSRHAGDLISEITAAIVGGMGLSQLSGVIHPYPTQAEVIKKAADTYRRTLLTPKTKKLLKVLTRLS